MNVQASNLARYQDEILHKIHQKGWNPYKSTDSQQVGADVVLRRGRADKLEINERYVLMPLVDDHNNPIAVFDVLEKVALEQLNRQTPTISINRYRFPWTGFKPREKDVKVNTIIGHYLNYPEFISSLDSITQIYL